jgi:hypothetical protein
MLVEIACPARRIPAAGGVDEGVVDSPLDLSSMKTGKGCGQELAAGRRRNTFGAAEQ